MRASSATLGFGLIITALMGLIVAAAMTIRTDLATLQAMSKQNLLWSVTELDRDFSTLRIALTRFALDPGEGGAALRHDFDILWSRVETFRAGDVGKRLMAEPAVETAVTALQATLRGIDPRIQALGDDGASAQDARRIGTILTTLEPGIRRASVDVLHAKGARFEAIREQIRAGVTMTAIAMLLPVLIAILASLLFRRQAQRSRALADASARAVADKARFFSMMSHELRTPLNGLLGTLNLVQNAETAKERKLLMNEAVASSRRLSDILTDALELGADEEGVSGRAIFRMADIAKMPGELIGIGAPGERILFTGDTWKRPSYVAGDLRRLRQAISHLLLSALQWHEGNRIALDVTHGDGVLTVAITVDGHAPSEMFCETLAEGLMERTGGRMERLADGWLLSLPVEEATPSARILLSTPSLEKLYAQLLESRGVRVTTSDSDEFHFALAEPMLDEKVRAALRARYPHIPLIACGASEAVVGFDAVLQSPEDLDRTLDVAFGYPSATRGPLAA